MYEPIWQAAARHLSIDRMKSAIGDYYALSRFSSSDKINALARLIAAQMTGMGLHDVRLIEFPADGATAHGGWFLPEACDVESARLIARINGVEEILADYQSNPTGLMVYSRNTPPEGVEAELVVADSPAAMTPDRVSGKIVLTSGIGVVYSEAAARSGALGLVSDCRASARLIKDGPYLDTTNEWHNYTIPPWRDPGQGFGFSISPAQGRSLRSALDAGQSLQLHATVISRHYTGTLPVISGVLPGLSPEEIAITGHFDEFGADDNGSQIAVALEAVRSIQAMIAAGELPPLARSIRILFPMEVRGFNALIQRNEEIAYLCAGLNIDTVGTDQNATTTYCSLTESFMAAPSFVDDLAAELLDRVSTVDRLFRWRRSPAETIDNIFGEPLVGAPTPAIYHFSGTHHLALDTPDRISGPMLHQMARLTAVYAAFLANAGLQEALYLAELSAVWSLRRIDETASRALRGCSLASGEALLRAIRSLQIDGALRLASTAWLVPAPDGLPAAEDTAETELLGADRLFPEEALASRIRALQEKLILAARSASDRVRSYAASFSQVTLHPTLPSAPDSRCVPIKTFRGFLSFEDRGWEERQQLHNEFGITPGWGAPLWLQNALMLANGKRTAAEIREILLDHGAESLPDLEPIFALLEQHGRVRLRPYLSQQQIQEALSSSGIRAGDLVLGHFSLSRFGYVEGGADALIDAILELLGPTGTLVMPAFGFSWLGRPPFDPAATPSRVGIVTDRFWRRPGVLRSRHPTHSFAACGPLAAHIIEGHDHTCPPLDRSGPAGRLADSGGKILMFAPPGANTLMHAGEYWAGIPYPDYACPIVENGRRQLVIVPDCPWHAIFEPAYEKLYARGLIRDVPLGDSVIHTMRCSDAIEAQAEVARESPGKLVARGCDCRYCRALKEWIARRS